MVHGRGLSVVLSYKYGYNPSTDIVRALEPTSTEVGFNLVHLACIFDQEQVIDLLGMYGLNNLNQW